jgi:hypothetical protein
MLTHGFAAVSTDIPSANKENLLIKALKEKAEVGTPKKAPRPIAPKASPEPLAKNDFQSKLAALMGGAAKPADKNTNLQKPLLYSAALAAVLLGMGYLSRSQGSLLGDNADSAFPAAPAVAKPAKPKPKTPAAATTAPAPKRISETQADSNAAENDAANIENSVAADNGDTPLAKKAEPKNVIRSGTDKVAEVVKNAPNSKPLDSSSIDNNANEPQLTPSSSRRHRRHQTNAAQERSPRHHKHRAPDPEPEIRHHTRAPKAKVHKVHVYQPTTVRLYDESGNPLRS